MLVIKYRAEQYGRRAPGERVSSEAKHAGMCAAKSLSPAYAGLVMRYQRTLIPFSSMRTSQTMLPRDTEGQFLSSAPIARVVFRGTASL
jgi:hypothetical protein